MKKSINNYVFTRGVHWVLGMLLFSMNLVAYGQNDIGVTFVPSTLNLQVGQRQVVDLRLDNIPATGLAAYQYQLNYDPSIVSIVDPNAAIALGAFQPGAWLLTSTGRSVGVSLVDTLTAGQIDLAYGTTGGSTPPSGSGVLSSFEIVALAEGVVNLAVTNVVFADNQNPPNKLSYLASPLAMTITAVIDTDGDGLSDDFENTIGTNINAVDTDNDGLSDFDEVNFDGDATTYNAGLDSNPLNPDTDGDGVVDGDDLNPLKAEVGGDEDIPFIPFWAQLLLGLFIVTRYLTLNRSRT